MTPDEHQRERMLTWRGAFQMSDLGAQSSAVYADHALAEFDKRFPAPAAVGVATGTREDRSRSYDEAFNDGWRTAQRAAVPPADPEYESLRTKARYWDAVASTTVRLNWQGDKMFSACWGRELKTKSSGTMPSAEEAVQAAIDAGALK